MEMEWKKIISIFIINSRIQEGFNEGFIDIVRWTCLFQKWCCDFRSWFMFDAHYDLNSTFISSVIHSSHTYARVHITPSDVMKFSFGCIEANLIQIKHSIVKPNFFPTDFPHSFQIIFVGNLIFFVSVPMQYTPHIVHRIAHYTPHILRHLH